MMSLFKDNLSLLKLLTARGPYAWSRSLNTPLKVALQLKIIFSSFMYVSRKEII